MALWLEKRSVDNELPLQQIHSFVLVTSALHQEFDIFKNSFQEYTKRGYSMFPLIELLAFWNAQRAVSSPVIDLFNNSYIHLHCTEVDELCDWIESIRVTYIPSQ